LGKIIARERRARAQIYWQVLISEPPPLRNICGSAFFHSIDLGAVFQFINFAALGGGCGSAHTAAVAARGRWPTNSARIKNVRSGTAPSPIAPHSLAS